MCIEPEEDDEHGPKCKHEEADLDTVHLPGWHWSEYSLSEINTAMTEPSDEALTLMACMRPAYSSISVIMAIPSSEDEDFTGKATAETIVSDAEAAFHTGSGSMPISSQMLCDSTNIERAAPPTSEPSPLQKVHQVAHWPADSSCVDCMSGNAIEYEKVVDKQGNDSEDSGSPPEEVDLVPSPKKIKNKRIKRKLAKAAKEAAQAAKDLEVSFLEDVEKKIGQLLSGPECSHLICGLCPDTPKD